MTENQSIQIIEALANGVDPISGEIFPENSPYQDISISRALFHALEALKKKPKRSAKDPKDLPERQGEKWTEKENEHLLKMYKDGTSIAEIAQTHKRSKGAIRSQLLKSGVIKD